MRTRRERVQPLGVGKLLAKASAVGRDERDDALDRDSDLASHSFDGSIGQRVLRHDVACISYHHQVERLIHTGRNAQKSVYVQGPSRLSGPRIGRERDELAHLSKEGP